MGYGQALEGPEEAASHEWKMGKWLILKFLASYAKHGPSLTIGPHRDTARRHRQGNAEGWPVRKGPQGQPGNGPAIERVGVVTLGSPFGCPLYVHFQTHQGTPWGQLLFG